MRRLSGAVLCGSYGRSIRRFPDVAQIAGREGCGMTAPDAVTTCAIVAILVR
jgi:hypothetical protein